jgi:hypothetical protein
MLSALITVTSPAATTSEAFHIETFQRARDDGFAPQLPGPFRTGARIGFTPAADSLSGATARTLPVHRYLRSSSGESIARGQGCVNDRTYAGCDELFCMLWMCACLHSAAPRRRSAGGGLERRRGAAVSANDAGRYAERFVTPIAGRHGRQHSITGCTQPLPNRTCRLRQSRRGHP